MPVSCQSWEMASGPTFAYNLAARSNSCTVIEAPKGSNFSNFRVHDTVSRGFANSGEAPKGAAYRMSSPQDNVVWGLSALSLCGQSQPEADFTSEESRSVPLGSLCCASPEVYRCMPPRSNGSLPFALAPPSSYRKPLGSYGLTCDVGFVSNSEGCNQQPVPHIHENASGDFSHMELESMPQKTGLSTVCCATSPVQFCHADKVYEQDSLDSFPNTFGGSNFTLAVARKVTQHSEDDLEPDTISESSLSLGNDMPLASSSSSGEVSQLSDDTEDQIAIKEAAGLSSSIEAASFPRKGLSQFYAGKSRSFSCLSDAVSVRDLAKPENPYSRKRRVNVGGARLPPLQKGAASISKKQLHNGKSTLALAMAMSKEEEYESQTSLGLQRCPKGLVSARSYSLSDLEGAGGSLFFIG